MTNHLAYAGIGSRETPQEILEMMTMVASGLERRGWLLRSGGAPGADTAFANGVSDWKNKRIYLPWRGFNGNRGKECIALEDMDQQFVKEAEWFTAQVHPAWYDCNQATKLFHTRNVFQVIGDDNTNPSKFILCWTQGGRGHGGTGQAIRIAKKLDIPVFDLGKDNIEKVQNDCLEYIQKIEDELPWSEPKEKK